ncbi:MAG: CHAT domain-containing protein [Rubrivivax sp.]|nr:CHAT domain-containing protein [Rubrivivax sp.]
MALEQKALGAATATIRFGNGTTLQGLGGEGVVRQRLTEPGRLRSAALPSGLDTGADFNRALAALGIREQETIDLEATALRAAAGDELTLAPAVPRGDTAPRVVLYQDESGGISWHFAEPAAAQPQRWLRGPANGPRFVIPMRNAASRRTLSVGMPRRQLRGVFTKVGRKIFKVLVLPVLSALLEDPVRWLGEQVERRWRDYRLWQPTPDNYRHPPPEAAFDDLKALRGGPVLLLVHGIFSSVQGMLAGLPRSAMERWCERYEGRVLAFDHPTVSASPEDNARELLQRLAQALPGEPLTVDILCHSRGGIVSRTLAERADALLPGHTLHVRSVYFAATPNAGSPLGDADHMVDMIDLFTNCLTSFPDGPVAYSMEVILGLVTLVAHAGVTALPGIAALGMKGSYITDTLNRATAPSRALYGAAAANFEPQPGRENGWLIDKLADPVMDRVFVVDGRHLANDLVVPQQGVFAANGHPSFPIADPLVFGAEDGVWHTAFFAQPRAIAHIEAHFERAVPRAAAAPPRARMAPPPPASAPEPKLLDALRGGSLRSGTLRGGSLRRGAPSAAQPMPASVPQVPTNGPEARRAAPVPAAARRPATKAAPAKHAAAPGRAAEAVQRDPALQFHERMETGQSDDLLVLLNPPAAGAAPAGRMTLVFEFGADEIELVAEVSAPGFTVAGARHATLRILRERDPQAEQARFHLTALDPGAQPVERAIVVSFFRGNECVGSATHHTVVVPRGWQGATQNQPDQRSPVRLAAQRRDAADLVVYVRRPQADVDVFTLSLRSQLPGQEYESRDFGSFDLGGKEISTYLAETLDPSFQQFPAGQASRRFDALLATWNARFLDELADLGRQLWMHLPQAFRDEYLRLAGLAEPPRSICIYSDELEFPWEIVRPSGSVNGHYAQLPPLGVSHVLGRWRPSVDARPQPQAMRVTGMAVVIPDAQAAGLPWAAQESRELQALIPCAQAVTPADRAQLKRLLARTDVQLVHFSGHGVLGPNADLAALELEGTDQIKAMAFASSMLGSVAQPVLYLNACSVGRGSRVMGRSGGFAGNCIASGWSGVVAPYWPVYDPSAAHFGVAFYRKLKAGLAIGEALCELRDEMRDDPTAQSYAYYGDPFARVLFA